MQSNKQLENITLENFSLRNDNVYRNQIEKGIIHNTEIYGMIIRT